MVGPVTAFAMHGFPSQHSRPAKSSFGIMQIIKRAFRPISDWFRAGNPPPQTHRSSICHVVFFNVLGLLVLTVWLMALFNVRLHAAFTSIVPLAFVAFILLCPGIYGAWVSLCAWRRIPGYDWSMIPRFQ